MAKVMCNRGEAIMQLFNERGCRFECNFVFPSNEPTDVPGRVYKTNSRVTGMAGIRRQVPAFEP